MGTRFGPYEILASLGAGGMGEVYRAQDTKLDRQVAVKVLPERLAEDQVALARFEREAKAVAALSHPNILAIHDFGTQDGAVYAVTELLEGETLRERLAGGALPPRKAVELAVQIANGLAAAHDKGIVHRDLKPANVFVTRGGQIKILDFGLAKPSEEPRRDDVKTEAPTQTQHTDPGSVVGTVGYMSPEQVRGEPADQRSDIFSLGVILYEMLSGQRAFARDTPAETMTAILKEEPPDLLQTNADLPSALERTVQHCLEKSSEERFQSARDLAFDLENASGSSTVSAERWIAAPAATTSPLRRILLPLALVIAGGLLGAGLNDLLRPARTPVRVRTLTFSGHDRAPSASPDGRMVAFASTRDGRPRIWIKQLAGGGEAPLTSGPDDLPRFSPDGSTVLFLREEGAGSSLYRTALVGREPRKLLEDVLEADWSPDGKEITFLRQRREATGTVIGVVDAPSGEERLVAESAKSLYGVRWSPDGRWIAANESSISGNVLDDVILLVAPESGKAKRLSPAEPEGVLSTVTWLGSGEALLFAQAESLVGDQSSSSSEVIRYLLGSEEEQTLFWARNLFPPSGTDLDFTRFDVLGPGLLVFNEVATRQNLLEFEIKEDLSSAQLRALIRGNSHDRQPAYSPDGDQVIFSSNRSGNLDLWILTTSTGAVRQLTDDPALDWDPAFTPDGRNVIWSSSRSGNLEIWMAEADGSGARQVSQDGADAENPTATRDGQWFVYASGNPDKLGVWKIRPDGTEATMLVPGAYLIPDLSPDGRYALYVYSQRSLRSFVRVVEIETGKVVPFEIQLPFEIGSRTVVWGRGRWMPDGRAIAFVGLDEAGLSGVFVQDFVPGQETSHTRRKLAGFSPDFITESFGISPDGSRLTLSTLEQTQSLMLAENVPGVVPPTRKQP